jgi:hypothetical protein
MTVKSEQERTFAARRPEETDAAFEARRICYPYFFPGETEAEHAQRMHQAQRVRHEQNEARKVSILAEIALLDAREPFLNELYRQIDNECLTIRCRRRDLQKSLEWANQLDV